MKIAYGCIPSLMSLYVVNYLVRKTNLNIECIIISKADFRVRNKKLKNLEALPYFIKRFGLRYTAYLIGLSKLFYGFSFFMLNNDEQSLFSYKKLAERYQVHLIFSKNFSDDDTINQIRQHDIDLLATCFCDQILKSNLLQTPRYGCVNIHPSILPDFRGVDPVFQIMLHNIIEYGVTLHQTSAGIDKGNIISFQKISRAQENSHLLLNIKAALNGIHLLLRYVKSLEYGERETIYPQDNNNIKYGYRSYPTREEIKQFYLRGNKFLNLKELRDVVQFKY